jgi:hypothetical protein
MISNGMSNEAIKYYSLSTELDPEDSNAYFNLSMQYIRKKYA